MALYFSPMACSMATRIAADAARAGRRGRLVEAAA